MTERPILFSGPMVRALLDGTKTQTRRIAPIRDLNIISHPGDMVTWAVSFLEAVKGVLSSHSGGKFSDIQARSIIASQFNPYGQPGDRLWVREAWRAVWSSDHEPPRQMNSAYRVWYEADAPLQDGFGRLRPSIHMPRWASRITLEIVSVRVERLQDISEADAVAEGIKPVKFMDCGPHRWTNYHDPESKENAYGDPISSYRSLWDSINGPGSWDANPWVWVVEFKVVTP